jgi:hypothetical protein
MQLCSFEAKHSHHADDDGCQKQERDSSKNNIKLKRNTHVVSPVPVADLLMLADRAGRATKKVMAVQNSHDSLRFQWLGAPIWRGVTPIRDNPTQ